MRKRILISGSSGQLGNELQEISCAYPEYEFVFKNRQALNFTSYESIEAVFLNEKFDYFINAAAYTNVDKAEENSDLCYQINSDALTQICSLLNQECTIIHISTDYVYNQNPGRPLIESDETFAKGIYAQSKLAGEKIILSSNPNNIVIRTSWVYSTYGHNFMKTMLRLAKTKNALNIVNDQIGCPTYAKDIASAIMHIVKSVDKKVDKKTQFGGIYNFSNEGQVSWADFAQKIFELKNKECHINPISTETYNAPAHRPKWSVLSKEKAKQKFNLDIFNWEERLKICLKKLHGEFY